MKYRSTRVLLLAGLFASATVISSCNDDENPPKVTAQDFEVTIDENPEADFEIGTIDASTDKGTLSYEIESQSVAGAIAVDAASGTITVADPTKFDFETNPEITAVVNASSKGTTTPVNVTINLQKIIWTGPATTFTKAHGADWTLAANQDRITATVAITRQNSGPIYNYQWWMDTFDADATSDDLVDDFWNNTNSTREFTRSGGTIGIRWAILDNTGATDNEAWAAFDLYGTLGDPTHFYSFHNICSMLTALEDNTAVTGVQDDFYHLNGTDTYSGTNMPYLVGKKLAMYIVDEEIYMTVTFSQWGSGGSNNSVAYSRSTPD